MRPSQTRVGRYIDLKEIKTDLNVLSEYVVGHDIENINNYPSVVLPVIKNNDGYCTVQTFGRTYTNENTFATLHIHNIDKPGFIHHTTTVNNLLKDRNYRIGHDSLWAMDSLNVVCFSSRNDEKKFAERLYKLNKNPLQVMHIAETTGNYHIILDGVKKSIAYMIKKGRDESFINIFYRRWEIFINKPLKNLLEEINQNEIS